MLVVIFGAGASFDSDPDRLYKRALPGGLAAKDDDRPPLANELFSMDRAVHRDAAMAFPRATPALMRARRDVAASSTIEAALQRLQEEAVNSARARAQIMALRFYIQRVITQTPDAWERNAARQTSYVSFVDTLAQWQETTRQPVCLITFNYDQLLERAVTLVYGYPMSSFEDYVAHDDLHLFKPHGSVNWAFPAPWDEAKNSGDKDEVRRAIIDDTELRPGREPHVVANAYPNGKLGSNRGMPVAWIPALAIPVERKPDIILPTQHRGQMYADLAQARTVIAAGWRAREQHFLDILRNQLPQDRRLAFYSVSATRNDAQETVDNIWPTHRFDRFAVIDGGFSQFAAPEASLVTDEERQQNRVTIGTVLRQSVQLQYRPLGPDLAATRAPQPGLTVTWRRSPFSEFE